MDNTPTYEELIHKVRQLETEILEHVNKEIEFNKKQKSVEYGHVRRTISLMKINEELNKEIKELKRAGKEEMELVSDRLRERIKELNCLYSISSLRAGTIFSLDHILQAVVDFIPPAIQYPDITCARIRFDRYEFKTNNFKDTKWKLSQEIMMNNECIGTVEVCHLEKKPELEERHFLEEAKNLITAISENIAQIVEREQEEIEMRKSREKIQKLIKTSQPPPRC
jgi:hypothetical protein